MSGNASFRLGNTSILSVCAVEAPIVMPSSAFDDRLAAAYERVGLLPGMLVKLAGVRERRWWPRTSASPTAPRWPAPRRWPRPASNPSRSA